MGPGMEAGSFRERYPPPWRAEVIPGGYRVVSGNGFALAYIYALDGFARSASPQALKPAEALALARAICRLGDFD